MLSFERKMKERGTGKWGMDGENEDKRDKRPQDPGRRGGSSIRPRSLGDFGGLARVMF